MPIRRHHHRRHHHHGGFGRGGYSNYYGYSNPRARARNSLSGIVFSIIFLILMGVIFTVVISISSISYWWISLIVWAFVGFMIILIIIAGIREVIVYRAMAGAMAAGGTAAVGAVGAVGVQNQGAFVQQPGVMMQPQYVQPQMMQQQQPTMVQMQQPQQPPTKI